MLVERDISSAFLYYRRLLGVAGLGVLAAAATSVVRDTLPDESSLRPWVGSAHTLVLIGLMAIVGATYAWFRASLRHLAQTHKAQLLSAHTDILTGAMSRAHFMERMKVALKDVKEHPFSYIQLDMDNLKVINDGYGHKAGDAALVRIVAALRQAAPQAVIGRLGGDEFGVLVGGGLSRRASIALAHRVLEILAQPMELPGLSLQLSATMGLAMAPEDGDCLESLLANADLALYAGKNQGRCTVVPFDKEMSADERHLRYIERELRGAILMDELDVHYQPIVDVQGRDIGAFEALVRWNHSFRGMISPSDFVPVAERSPLIDALGEWVLRRVCRDIQVLGARSVSVNVSLVQLRRPSFARVFLDILREENTPADRIVAEITETVRLTSSAVEMRNLETLIAAGVRISIDDFGSGATSLDYLRRIRFHTIKIDRSYVANIHKDPVGMALVGAISSIGRALDIKVVAEGVETEEQQLMLQAAGCTHLQGFLFGKPRSIRAMRARRSSLSTAA
jgi:diguanylate cyclase (GGDEF)-like protein